MKRSISKWLSSIIVFVLLMFIFSGMTFAKSVIVDHKSGSGDVFKTNDYVYYRVTVNFPDSLVVYGVYGFTNWDRYNRYIKSCSSSTTDDGKATWEKRYAFTLCDKNKKTIDPVGWHKPGKNNYRTIYFLKKGIYYIRIKTGKKKCNIYGVRSFLMSEYNKASSNTYKNDGGKTKAKAVLIKSPDQKGYASYIELVKDKWHGSCIAFPLMGSDKYAETWFKFYSDGVTPLYIVVRLGQSSGKWVMIFDGPTLNGKGISLPEKAIMGKNLSQKFYKNGKEVHWGNIVKLARTDGKSFIGPKPGWYYIHFIKRSIYGKKNDYYRKCSLCADIYITKDKSLVKQK